MAKEEEAALTITWKWTAPVLIAFMSISAGLAAQDPATQLVDEALLS